MNTITFKNQAAQGDLLLIRVDEIPNGFNETKPLEDVHVLAHSETGHNHVMSSNCASVYECDAEDGDVLTAYLVVKETSDLKHLRDYDTHKTISVPPGTYKISRQREYTPEGFRRAAD